MRTTYETGRSKLIKGSMLYLWEEVKTINRRKIKALSRIVTGFIKMKFKDQKIARARKQERENEQDYLTW